MHLPHLRVSPDSNVWHTHHTGSWVFQDRGACVKRDSKHNYCKCHTCSCQRSEKKGSLEGGGQRKKKVFWRREDRKMTRKGLTFGGYTACHPHMLELWVTCHPMMPELWLPSCAHRSPAALCILPQSPSEDVQRTAGC